MKEKDYGVHIMTQDEWNESEKTITKAEDTLKIVWILGVFSIFFQCLVFILYNRKS